MHVRPGRAFGSPFITPFLTGTPLASRWYRVVGPQIGLKPGPPHSLLWVPPYSCTSAPRESVRGKAQTPGAWLWAHSPESCLLAAVDGWSEGPGNASGFGSGWPVKFVVQEAGGPGTQGAHCQLPPQKASLSPT